MASAKPPKGYKEDEAGTADVLPGRKPSRSFIKALDAVKRLGGKPGKDQKK